MLHGRRIAMLGGAARGENKLRLNFLRKNPTADSVQAPDLFTADHVRQIASDAAKQAVDGMVSLSRQAYSASDYTDKFPMVGAPIIPSGMEQPLVGKIPPPNDDKILNPKFPGAYKWDHPLWWTVPHNPIRRPQSLLSLDELRTIANRYDIIRSCINHLVSEVTSVPISWKPKDPNDKSRATKRGLDEMEHFFSTPGGLGGRGVTRTAYEYSIFEDLCVLGVAAVWLPQTLSMRPTAAIDIDAATIRPRVNAFGYAPTDEWRYEQWVYGTIQAMFYDDDLIYSGIYRTTRSPYFSSPIEWLLTQIEMAVGYDRWNTSWLRDGNTSDTYIEAPETWTPDNLYTYTSYLDQILSGDIQMRQKVKLLAPGASIVNTKSKRDMEFISGEQWLARRCCALFGVHMSAMGFEGQDYAANVNNSMKATSSFGTGRLLRWRKEHYEDLATRMGYPQIECVNEITDLSALEVMARIDSTYVNAGVVTPNEARVRSLKLDPFKKEGDSPADQLYLNGTMVPIDSVESVVSSGIMSAGGVSNKRGTGKVQGNEKAASKRDRNSNVAPA